MFSKGIPQEKMNIKSKNSLKNNLFARAGIITVAAICTISLTIPISAYAFTDVALDATESLYTNSISDTTSSDSDASSEELPESIDSSISNDATVISPDYVLEEDGTVVEAKTGNEVTDKSVIGTNDTPADPLEKTDGESYIPVSVGDARDELGDTGSSSSSSDSSTSGSSASTEGGVKNASFAITSAYGAYWGTYNSTTAFYQKNGTLFTSNAKKVIDVSSWQGTIDWAKAKADGVEGAIIRIGYGVGNADSQAKANITACKKYGIPFGIYLYSYAYDSSFATREGNSTASLLSSYGVSSSDLAYPIFYDLEAWTWAGHTRPRSASTYSGIVSNYISTLSSAGYSNVQVYSYTSYLNSSLNSSSIWSKVGWVAQYSGTLGYSSFSNSYKKGWQYQSTGTINGISGNVDMNAFADPRTVDLSGAEASSVFRVYNPNSGLHHYTTNGNEVASLVADGWNYEGVSFIAEDSGSPVYRVYDPYDGNHLLTLSSYEKESLVKLGWIYEGIAFYVDNTKTNEIYRLYNPNSGEHFFTASSYEYSVVGKAGWHKEGIAWHAQ